MLRIALENLLRNAWKYSANVSPAMIEFGCETNEKKQTVYFVKDNGVGFNMAYSDKLFRAFSRLHSDEEFEGTGIGLATVHRIISRHGGSIWVDAKVDGGAQFFFTFSKA
jgi:light-regulated signal transduction histidine kinase (bacteriophytochrome)